MIIFLSGVLFITVYVLVYTLCIHPRYQFDPDLCKAMEKSSQESLKTLHKNPISCRLGKRLSYQNRKETPKVTMTYPKRIGLKKAPHLIQLFRYNYKTRLWTELKKIWSFNTRPKLTDNLNKKGFFLYSVCIWTYCHINKQWLSEGIYTSQIFQSS